VLDFELTKPRSWYKVLIKSSLQGNAHNKPKERKFKRELLAAMPSSIELHETMKMK
jgi:hypothetical protein